MEHTGSVLVLPYEEAGARPPSGQPPCARPRPSSRDIPPDPAGRRRRPAFCGVLLRRCSLLLVLVQLAGRLPAQVPIQPPAREPGQELSSRSLEELAATLEDPASRGKLLEQIKALIAVQGKTETGGQPADTRGLVGGLLGFFQGITAQVRNTLVELVEQAGRIPARLRTALDGLKQPEALARFLQQVLIFAGLLVGCILSSLALWLLLSRRRAALQGKELPSRRLLLGRLLQGAALLLLDLLPPAILTAAALIGLSLAPADPGTRVILLAVVWALVLHRVGSAALDFLLAPGVPKLRLIPLEDGRARSLAASLGRIIVLGVYGYFLLRALEAGGVDEALIRPLKSIYGLLLLGSGIVLVLKERKKLQASLAGLAARPLPKEKRAGAWRSVFISALGLWWLLAIVYMVGLYLVWAGGKEGGFAFLLRATAFTALAAAAAALLLTLGRKILERTGKAAESLGVRYPELATRVPRYRSGLRVLLDTVVIALASCFALEAWGVSVLAALESAVVQDILRSIFGILIIVIAATAFMDFATVFSRRYLEGREREGKAGAKVRTLVPLIQKALRVAIVVLAAIMVLEQAGIQIGPILAGVGILGLAVGFGAQTLVKDVITGFFILLEDTFSIGDVITVNGTGGLVEAIGIRTVRLRDVSGNVHTIPFSSVGTVTNMTKDYSMYLIEAAVAYREDVDEVIAVLKEIDEGLRKDPEFGRDIQKPIEIMGLDRFEDSAVIVRARLTTKPSQQWRVGREFNRRMKKAFDQKDIEIPFPHRTIYFGKLKDGTAPPVEVKASGRKSRGHLPAGS